MVEERKKEGVRVLVTQNYLIEVGEERPQKHDLGLKGRDPYLLALKQDLMSRFDKMKRRTVEEEDHLEKTLGGNLVGWKPLEIADSELSRDLEGD